MRNYLNEFDRIKNKLIQRDKQMNESMIYKCQEYHCCISVPSQ